MSMEKDTKQWVINLEKPTVFNQLALGGRIGVLMISNDLASDSELRRVLPENYTLHCNRVNCPMPVSVENLAIANSDLSRAAAHVLPELQLDAFVYNCTSSTAVIGIDETHAQIRKARPEVSIITDPLSATLAALRAVGAKKVTVLTPYTATVNEQFLSNLQSLANFEIVKLAGFGCEGEEEITSTPFDFIKACVLQIFDPKISDALFISCTGLTIVNHIEELETAIGCPVVTSNQAVAWHLLRLMSPIQPVVRGFGKLFDYPLPGLIVDNENF